MALLFTLTFTANAMSYEQAREQALFLTDKMAYELNLTDDQYEAAYEINLDYLMSVNTVDDLYGSYWRYRNLDMSYVLLDWQYRAFCDAAYFYRPLYFSGGYWRFGIYARYPHRDYFYFNRPAVYVNYCGGHSWRNNHGRSWYDGRHFGPRPGGDHFGMRDGFNRGDYGRGNRQSFGQRQPQQRGTSSFGSRVNTQLPNGSYGNRNNDNAQSRPNGSFGSRNNVQNRPGSSFGNRESSTRTTVRQQPAESTRPFGSSRGTVPSNMPRPTFTPSQPSTSRQTNSQPSFGSSRGSFGGSRGGGQVGSPSRSSGSGQSTGGGSPRGSFGSRR